MLQGTWSLDRDRSSPCLSALSKHSSLNSGNNPGGELAISLPQRRRQNEEVRAQGHATWIRAQALLASSLRPDHGVTFSSLLPQSNGKGRGEGPPVTPHG